jgi:hypothetical protein
MTNDQIRRNTEIRITKPNRTAGRFWHSGFGFVWSLVIGHWSFLSSLSASTSCVAAIRRRALVLMLCGPLLQAAEAPSPIQLKDVTRQTGITFVHTDGSSGRRYIVESV